MHQPSKNFQKKIKITSDDIRILATELYKTKEDLDAPVMYAIFEQRNIQYNLCSQADFQLGSLNTVNYGLKAFTYLGPKN